MICERLDEVNPTIRREAVARMLESVRMLTQQLGGLGSLDPVVQKYLRDMELGRSTVNSWLASGDFDKWVGEK